MRDPTDNDLDHQGVYITVISHIWEMHNLNPTIYISLTHTIAIKIGVYHYQVQQRVKTMQPK